MFLRRNLVSNCRFARYIGTPAESSLGMRSGKRCQNAHHASEVPHRIRPRTRMSDRNGTPTFYENTMRLATARCLRRFGTKDEANFAPLEQSCETPEELWAKMGGSCNRSRERPRATTPNRNFLPTFFQLCSIFVPKLPRQRVFKKREIRAGFHFGRSYGSGA